MYMIRERIALKPLCPFVGLNPNLSKSNVRSVVQGGGKGVKATRESPLENRSMGKLPTHWSSSSWVNSRPLRLVPNTTFSDTVPFGHIVLRHMAPSKPGMRSSRRRTMRKVFRGFPSAGPS
jgi:hypothetical protein